MFKPTAKYVQNINTTQNHATGSTIMSCWICYHILTCLTTCTVWRLQNVYPILYFIPKTQWPREKNHVNIVNMCINLLNEWAKKIFPWFKVQYMCIYWHFYKDQYVGVKIQDTLQLNASPILMVTSFNKPTPSLYHFCKTNLKLLQKCNLQWTLMIWCGVLISNIKTSNNPMLTLKIGF